jgi:CHAT domain-containing protein
MAILPLHAAGTPIFENLSSQDPYFIPSYTPSLSALITARRHATELYRDPKLLIVGAWGVADVPELPDVPRECKIVREQVPSGEDLLGSLANREQLSRYIPDHNWVHFACHGLHDDDEPFESAFMLSDGPFTLRDIITTHPGFAGFAFLSACQTATLSSSAPNEVLHLSAGMQFCGFASVIGTQWPVVDRTAADVAELFYKDLFHGGNEARLTCSADALHTSLMMCKDRGTSVEHLVPFIHVGI